MPYISDEMLKELVYGLMVDESPGIMVCAETLWDNYPDIVGQLSEAQQDDAIDRLDALVRRARVTITFDDELR
jgi:hypothetical protein